VAILPTRRKYRELKELAVCPACFVNPSRVGRVICETCAEEKRRRERLYNAHGLCRMGCGRPIEAGYRQYCAEHRAQRANNRRARRRAA
jgi:hypothetical protein